MNNTSTSETTKANGPFLLAALQGLIAGQRTPLMDGERVNDAEDMARWSYDVADAMLREGGKHD